MIAIIMTTVLVISLVVNFLMFLTEVAGKDNVKSREKIASTEEAVSVIEKGWVYKYSEDNQLVKCSIDHLFTYVDESADGLYLGKRRRTLGIFSMETDTILIMPKSIVPELYERESSNKEKFAKMHIVKMIS